MRRLRGISLLLPLALVACSSYEYDRKTLADLHRVEPDLADVHIADSLERAEASYRRYLEQTPSSAMAPEAMRRMADLQIEKEFGIIGSGELIEMAVEEDKVALSKPPKAALLALEGDSPESGLGEGAYDESGEDFEKRATSEHQFAESTSEGLALPDGASESAISGPLEAIATYQRILDQYPNYERNDQVLYQMSRAYDELGRNDEAIEVMARLIAAYPYSRYVDEVNFRRGEYYFVRKKYIDAEEAYSAIIERGATSSYYELALYKMGWTLYKQEFYEEALDRYMAMLDYRLTIGYDFDQVDNSDDEHRVSDTFRVISLSFSNLGGPEVIDEYFDDHGYRTFADRIYSNLGEFYLDKLRYQDAAAVYNSFIERNPYHRVAPHFSMRVVEIYEQGEFPKLVVDSKKEFATRYALQGDYWLHFDPAEAPEVMGFLKTNLTDLANHYHALYQGVELAEEKPANFREASHWYRQFLASFPQDEESPAINYQLADLLFENGDFGLAAVEYERTAYDYARHDRSSAAGYAAVYAYRQDLEGATGARRTDVRLTAVESSLRFAETFPEHEEAPVVLGAAADDLYDMKDYARAIASARTLIERYPATEQSLIRAAWVVVGHSSIDIAEYPDAEHAYSRVLALMPPEDEGRAAIVDGLAASIYKQGEQANLLEDYRAAANHFLRIKDVAPTSAIRTAAEYDAAAALVKLEDWGAAAGVLEDFRDTYADHELAADATRQLAFIYREDGNLRKSAEEHVRIADESDDPDVRRETLLVAGGLYEEAASVDDAIRIYDRYVAEYPLPLDVAQETRMHVAEIHQERGDRARYLDELREIVAADSSAGGTRTDRSRFLAAKSALVLTEPLFERFVELDLVQPFEESLAEKQLRMDTAMAAFEALVAYEVGEVTAAATYYIAEIYYDFSVSLIESERPEGLSSAEASAYELVIEEEAYPFEEQAIEVHESNFELLRVGLYNGWVQRSLDKLAVLMPGRYAKNEISSGFLGSIDFYAYRMPIVPDIVPDGGQNSALTEPGAGQLTPNATARVFPDDKQD